MEIFFFSSIQDGSVAQEAIRLGSYLVVNKDYGVDENLIALSADSRVDTGSFHRFFILPSDDYMSEIFLGTGTRKGEGFRYIKDRVGAAAIDLIVYNRPSGSEVFVGSLAFHPRTYPSPNDPLELRPPIFSKIYQSLRSFIKRSAQPISNQKTPKTVYVFPKAFELLKEDPLRSPWSTLRI